MDPEETLRPPRLTFPERRQLLSLARETIRAAIEGRSAPAPAALTPSLCEPSGVFVSLHISGELRGCVGTLVGDRPLHQNVARMAVAAAMEDPRFTPLNESELSFTEIEISRLSRPTPTTPEKLEIGRHGVCVVYRGRRAVFLPQVAKTHGWDRTRMLAELCQKAGLDAEEWQRPSCQLLSFEAEVFDESSEEGGAN